MRQLMISIVFLTGFAVGSTYVSAQSAPGFTCPAVVKVGIINPSGGWGSTIFGGQRTAAFSGASVDPSSGMMACEYDGLYIMVRPSPSGYTCARAVHQNSRDIVCTAIKPPPIKIPGKKGGP